MSNKRKIRRGLVNAWSLERHTSIIPSLDHEKTCQNGRSFRGRGDRIRTCDPAVPNRVRYQLRYSPTYLCLQSTGHLFLLLAVGPNRGHLRRPRNFVFENKFSREDFLANSHWLFSRYQLRYSPEQLYGSIAYFPLVMVVFCLVVSYHICL